MLLAKRHVCVKHSMNPNGGDDEWNRLVAGFPLCPTDDHMIEVARRCGWEGDFMVKEELKKGSRRLQLA